MCPVTMLTIRRATRDGVVGVVLAEAGQQGDVDRGTDGVFPRRVDEHVERPRVQVVHAVVVGFRAPAPYAGPGTATPDSPCPQACTRWGPSRRNARRPSREERAGDACGARDVQRQV